MCNTHSKAIRESFMFNPDLWLHTLAALAGPPTIKFNSKRSLKKKKISTPGGISKHRRIQVSAASHLPFKLQRTKLSHYPPMPYPSSHPSVPGYSPNKRYTSYSQNCRIRKIFDISNFHQSCFNKLHVRYFTFHSKKKENSVIKVTRS